MTGDRPVVPPGFHEGEVSVQQQAGVRAAAARLSGMLDPAEFSGGAVAFLSQQRFAALSGRDRPDRLWISPLVGPAGFLEATDAHTLRVHRPPVVGDPLHDLPRGQDVGLLVIDFARRRRFRINGWLAGTADTGLTIEADQAYGNCPQYIQQRNLEPDQRDFPTIETTQPAGTELTAQDIAQVTSADTFFLGTTHPTRGTDASHRGGPAGFVRVENERHLWWPDYPGNNMFNSFGNLAVDPTAALLFYDFATGRTLHLTGTARVEQTIPGTSGDDGHTGRRVVVSVEHTVLGPPGALRADRAYAYPRTPN